MEKRRSIKYTEKYNQKTKRNKIKSKKSRKSRKSRKSKKSRKSRKSRKNKTFRGGGKWVVENDDLPETMCPICFYDFSETPDQAVYKTDCGHVFHNNCLNKYCIKNERRGNPQICPMCRKDLNTEKSDQCTDVWAFKNKALATSRLDQKNREIYDRQPDDPHDEDDDDNNDNDNDDDHTFASMYDDSIDEALVGNDSDGSDDDAEDELAEPMNVNNNERRVARRIHDDDEV
jgi:hypothetical protein